MIDQFPDCPAQGVFLTAFFGDGGGVQDNPVVGRFVSGGMSEPFKGVGDLPFGRESVAFGVVARQFNRFGQNIHPLDAGACPAGIERECPRIAEEIQHAHARLNLACQLASVLALIQIKPRFQPCARGHEELQPAFVDENLLWHFPCQHGNKGRQPLFTARFHFTALQNPPGGAHRLQRLQPYRFEALHARSAHLHHQIIGEPVYNKPWHTVRLAEEQPVGIRLVHHRLPKAERLLKTPNEEGSVDRFLDGGENPHREPAQRVVGANPEPAVLRIINRHQCPHFGGAFYSENLALLHPRVSMLDFFLAPRFEPHFRLNHGRKDTRSVVYFITPLVKGAGVEARPIMSKQLETKRSSRKAKSPFEKLRIGGSSAYRLYALMAFYARERKPLFDEKVSQVFCEVIPEVCKTYNYELIAFRLTKEQVHLLIGFKPVDALADVVSNIKRSTSHRIFEAVPELEARIGRRNFWAEGYLVETMGYEQIEPFLRQWERRYKNDSSLVRILYDIEIPISPKAWARAMEILLPVERMVVKMLYGLEGETPKKPEEVAEILSLKPEDVEQIRKDTVERVRAFLRQQRHERTQGGKAHG